MPAYMVGRVRQCQWAPFCRTPSTHAVFDTYNEKVGDFCQRHAVATVENINAVDAAGRARTLDEHGS